MHLAPGTRLGPYEIVAPAGAGGMGLVHRARDTRLGRDVAIKVIAGHLGDDTEVRRRFLLEARAVAQLKHPHICTLYDVGQEGPEDYLVMELVEGEPLDVRLRKSMLPLPQVLRYGAEVAAALAAAHARGIAHRDLKPGNIMITAAGAKVLDFGLARAFGSNAALAADSGAATLTKPGTLLGTVPYMAPEQLEGNAPDARTDIFALGAVLFEMATGRPAFAAPSQVALIAAVLSSEPPPVSTLRPGTPVVLDRLIRACLAKAPADRWQSAHDVELQLRALAEAPADGTLARRRAFVTSDRVAWVITAGAVGIAAFALLRPGPAAGPAAPEISFAIPPPAGGAFSYSTEWSFLSVSPDGDRLAWVATDSAGQRGVWVRSLGAVDALPVAGTDGAQTVFWSPDSRSIAWFVSGRLMRMELPGGAPVTVAEIASTSGLYGTWGSDGRILFGGVQGDAIYEVAAGGGTPIPILRPDMARNERRVQYPWFLPDGRRFLYTVRFADGSGRLMEFVPGEAARDLMAVESMAQFVEPGIVVFVRDGTLLGQAFDWRSGNLAGDPFAAADGIRNFLSTGMAAFATSLRGTVVYQTGQDLQQFTWYDRAGRELGTVGSAAAHESMALSPDGRRLLFDQEQARLGTLDLWVLDLDRAMETPVATGRDTEGLGVWLPDADRVVYSVVRGSPPNLVLRSLDSETETRLLPPGDFQNAVDVSPDGRTLLFLRRAGGSFDLWTLALPDGGTPTPLLQTPYNENGAAFSPDGRFIGVISAETGRPELYVMPFPGPGGKTRVSTGGALALRWPRGSSEILYVSPEGNVFSAPVSTTPELRVGRPVSLFRVPARSMWNAFDVTRDGSRILASRPIRRANEGPLTVIANWAPRRD